MNKGTLLRANRPIIIGSLFHRVEECPVFIVNFELKNSKFTISSGNSFFKFYAGKIFDPDTKSLIVVRTHTQRHRHLYSQILVIGIH